MAKRDHSDIKIAGIYTICSRLGLPKWGPAKDKKMRALATMQSGKVALYQYHDWEPAWNVDWGWHVFRAKRYAKPKEIASLPWITATPEEARRNGSLNAQSKPETEQGEL